MSYPFLWGWGAAAIVSLVLVARIRAPRIRAAALLAFGTTCAMFLGEIVAITYHGRRPPGRITSPFTPGSLNQRHPELGFVLKPGARVEASRKWNDSTIFDVTYTVTDAGVRRTPGNPNGRTWVFVGCSFTFGEGVEDDETLPSRFSEQLGWKENVVNLAVSGYGVHHVLRQLETGRLGGVHPPVTHVIYQAIPTHVARAAGRARWDLDGPRYEISGDSVRFTGSLHGRTFIRLMRLAQKSVLFTRVIGRLYNDRGATDQEIEVYGRIVEQVAALTKRKLGAPFTVLFWDDDGNPETKRILARLTSADIDVIRATSIMTRRELDSLRIPHDPHPSPEAYRRLAKGLATYFGETP